MEPQGNFDHLPAAYIADSGEQVTAPAWRLLADGYYGDTHWLQNEILVMDMTPNHHLEPLNQAAALRMIDWLSSLPLNGAGLKEEDMVEASYMLRPREGVPEMTHDQYSRAVVKLALELKAKREGTGALRMPELQGVRPANRPDAPPMPNATFTDPTIGRFGAQHAPAVIHQPQRPQNKVRKVVPATGNLPPAGAQQTP